MKKHAPDLPTQTSPVATDARWDDLRVFLTLGRAGGLTQAGRMLDLNHATISRRLERLEAAMGHRLVERGRYQLALTTVGERVLAYCEQIEVVVSEINSPPDSGIRQQRVRVALAEGIATLHIGAVLGALRTDFPLLLIEVTHAAQVITFARREADLFLSLMRIDRAGIYCEVIGEITVGLFATPRYLDHKGRPAAVADLSGHDFIDYTAELVPAVLLDLLPSMVPDPQVFVRSAMIGGQLEAALAHCGIVALAEKIGQADERLEQVLPDVARTSQTVWLSRHQLVRELQPIKAFVKLLRKHFKA
jgi:DNA-binding transcriptional LysR family regulator